MLYTFQIEGHASDTAAASCLTLATIDVGREFLYHNVKALLLNIFMEF